jgi:hypothetical protein
MIGGVVASGQRVAERREPRAVLAVGDLSAAEIFAWTRSAVWVAAAFAFLWFEPNRNPRADTWDASRLHELGWPIDIWARWDSVYYLQIAHHGYDTHQSTAFFPLYPVCVGAVGRIFFGHYVLAGVVVSLAACLGTFVLLYRFAAPRFGEGAARRAVLYLALFPMSLFLQAVYPESLFMLLALVAFLCAERGRFGLAGIAAGGACLTRSMGFALLPALALLAWRGSDRRRSLAGLALAPLLFLVFPIWLWLQRGDPFEFVGVQQVWSRYVSRAGPLGGLWDGVYAGARGAWHVLHAPHPHLYHPLANGANPFHNDIEDVEHLAYLVIFLALAVLVWRWLGSAYGLFVAVGLAIPLSTPSHEWPLLSLPRFGLVLFPFFVALALVGRNARAHSAIVACSALFLGVSAVQWALWQWVA